MVICDTGSVRQTRAAVTPTENEFISIWNSCISVSEFLAKTGRKRASAINMASKLRRNGFDLRYMGFPDRHGRCNSRWKGGRRIRKDGYVMVYSPGHPFAYRNFVLEHRLVMESHLGRYLQPHEIVHHRNEDKNDNRLCNLELTVKSQHTKEHSTGKRYLRWKPRISKEVIYDLYWSQDFTLKECAAKLCVRYGAFRRHLIEFGIPFKPKGLRSHRKHIK